MRILEGPPIPEQVWDALRVAERNAEDTSGATFKRVNPSCNLRQLFVNNGGPNIADPAGLIVFAEEIYVPTLRDPAALEPITIYWTGWRARLIRWQINRWMRRGK